MTFEEASEMGIPRGAGLPVKFSNGLRSASLHRAKRFHLDVLADADSRQIEAIHEAILWADKRLVFRKIMEALFDNRTRRANIRTQAYNVYPMFEQIIISYDSDEPGQKAIDSIVKVTKRARSRSCR